MSFMKHDIINWSDVQRKNFVNNVDMSSLRAPWQNGLYKNQHTLININTKTRRDATDIKNKPIFCVLS